MGFGGRLERHERRLAAQAPPAPATLAPQERKAPAAPVERKRGRQGEREREREEQGGRRRESLESARPPPPR